MTASERPAAELEEAATPTPIHLTPARLSIRLIKLGLLSQALEGQFQALQMGFIYQFEN